VIVVIENQNAHKYSELMDEMFRLRARIFQDRLRWDVQVVDGLERDRYDDAGPVYVIYADDDGRKVKGCLRLLPTTGPTLLADIFSDTMPDATHLSAPTIWECTRFCIDDRFIEGRPSEGLLFTSIIMVEALGNLALKAGIESIIGNFDSSMLRLYRRIGCEVEILGSTMKYGRPVYLGLSPVSERLLRKIQNRLSAIALARGPLPKKVA
jgi:N-acyl-L-homoserine lactone synthetase